MDRAAIEGALRELAAELGKREVTARLYLVGGAVMLLAFDSRFSTDDVDGSVYPPEEVLAVAREIAQRRGLPADWLNDSAKGFIPVFKEPDWRPLFKIDNVEIVAADERSMLAMKLRASRGRRDQADIEFLLERCGISTEADAVELYEQFFPEDPLTPRCRPILRGAVAKLWEKRADRQSPGARSAQRRRRDGRFASNENPEADVGLGGTGESLV